MSTDFGYVMELSTEELAWLEEMEREHCFGPEDVSGDEKPQTDGSSKTAKRSSVSSVATDGNHEQAKRRRQGPLSTKQSTCRQYRSCPRLAAVLERNFALGMYRYLVSVDKYLCISPLLS